ncbi:MAG: pyridoxamine 5'-phosphate oxidase family protein [Pseudomonadota bacterium]
MTADTGDTWHPGELTVQARTGVTEKMAGLGPRLIRDSMPDPHRDFFTRLPMIIVGGEDGAGYLWAAPLFGEPGFIRAPSSYLLTITLTAPCPHPLFSQLRVNSRVGLLGIEFESRRRNRVNGYIVQRTRDQIDIAVQQSFGNCTRYIQRRQRRHNPQHENVSTEIFTNWNRSLRNVITNADTCFIASACPGEHSENNRGVDVSHRGGDPGFIRFDKQQRLLIPDYAGNNFFNTIGNLVVDSRVGLLFLGFTEGHIISLTATAEVLWKIDEPVLCGEHDRVIRLTLEAGHIIRNALPCLWQSMHDAP